jgi:plastocyanin
LPAVLLIAAGTEITAFHVAGGILAIWAVVVAALGIMRKGFPGSRMAETLVIAITAILVVGTVGSAIATSGEEGPESERLTGTEEKTGKEGSEAPDQGGTPAPDTSPESGQEPGAQGQDAPEGDVGQTLTLEVVESGGFAFDKDALEATTGAVRLTLNNTGSAPHNVALEGDGVAEEGEVVQGGGASEVEAELQPGEYTFYCSVPGHREAGMEGTLTVE